MWTMPDQSFHPLDGGTLSAVLFWAMVVIWLAAELLFIARKRSANFGPGRDSSLTFLAVAIGIAFWLDFNGARLFPGATIVRGAVSIFYLGLGLAVVGTVLRWYAVACLGRYFTIDVAATASQPVIGTGPYRYVRHPSYTGAIMTLIGFSLALGNWLGLVVMAILLGVAYAYRIHVEEAALLAVTGEVYARYMQRTWRLVPFLI
jgi:protein-S-isoprenylcysteine O-methyltransferase